MRSFLAIVSAISVLLLPAAASSATRGHSVSTSRSFNFSHSPNGTRSGTVTSNFNSMMSGLNSPMYNPTIMNPSTFVSSGLNRLSGFNNGALTVLPNGQVALTNYPTGFNNSLTNAQTTNNGYLTAANWLNQPFASVYGAGPYTYSLANPGLNGLPPYATNSYGTFPNNTSVYGTYPYNPYTTSAYGLSPFSSSFLGSGVTGSGLNGIGGFGAGISGANGFAPGISGGGAGFAPSVDDSAYDGGPPETPESTVLKGEAQLASATANYNLATAAAAVKASEAESRYLGNRAEWVKTYYAMRDIGREGREKERGPHASREELAQRAHSAAPRMLTSNQIDAKTGELHWPGYFKDAGFDDQRLALEECASNWVRYGELNHDDQGRVRENVATLYGVLRSNATELPPNEYVDCRTFLESLLFATTHSAL